MPTILDYASLSASLTFYAHRANLSTDYLIQAGQEQVERDIPDLNFGNYLRFQEAPYPPVAISNNGTTPVPSDWLGAKLLVVLDGSGSVFPLIFTAASYLYDAYNNRQPSGIPQYVARDLSTGGGSWPTTGGTLAFTTTVGQTVFSLAAGPAGIAVLFVSIDGEVMNPATEYTIAGTTLTLTNGALAGQIVLVQYAAAGNVATPMASGTSVLVYGPYPNSAYTVQGTYYQSAPLLSASQTTNWMVLNAPAMLQAACMVQAGLQIPDDKVIARWMPIYQQKLKALVDADKAERWAAGTLVVQVA